MLSRFGVALGALGLATGGLATGTPVHAQAVKIGAMMCDMGSGYVFGSSRELRCTFSPATGLLEH
jgi:hypothetical protein